MQLTRNYRLGQYILYGLITLGCLLGNLLSQHALTWFWIVLASELMVASLTLLPTFVPEGRRGQASLGGFTGCLLLLLLVCCLYTGGDWFLIAGVSVLFGMGLVFLPFALRALPLPEELAHRKVSLYVGIPFCPTRCAYCSFVSADVGRALKLIDPFLDALCRELAATGAMLADAGLRVRTVYFGGGTPTTLSAPQLDRLMGELADHIDLSGCTEYTVEAGRPDTITAEKLAVLARRGCSRVSVNPQTMQDAVLERMGRAHRADDILRAYALARESGIGCINMDLIAGLPGDSAEGFRASLEQVLDLGPENVTVHTLALKKGSRLMEEGGGLPSGAAVADMLDFAWAALRGAGQRPYYLYRQKYMSGSFENVGWCRPGAESLYNICMMEELHTIVSLGGGGVTKLVDRATGYIERLANAKYPQEYIQKIDAVCADKGRVAQFYAAHGR